MWKTTLRIAFGILLIIIGPGIQFGFAREKITQGLPFALPLNCISLINMGVGTTIIFVLIVLTLVLIGFRHIANRMVRKESEVEITAQLMSHKNVAHNISDDEVCAAISMAFYLYKNEVHDQENPVITMIKVSRTYSPWSSKIYGLRKSPR